ncbi:hypothetical protein [Sphingomonas melonis]|uniref:hypothetical protein n=1 Tax=Sphingomonas melonis TaxID=152682 RepID=UPI0012E8111E|nr:hypothetical protein [Sphingomonas melonis]
MKFDMLRASGFSRLRPAVDARLATKKLHPNLFDLLSQFPERGIKIGSENGDIILALALQSSEGAQVCFILPLSMDADTARHLGQQLIDHADEARYTEAS